jgi:hypothetical protein
MINVPPGEIPQMKLFLLKVARRPPITHAKRHLSDQELEMKFLFLKIARSPPVTYAEYERPDEIPEMELFLTYVFGLSTVVYPKKRLAG